MQKFRPTIGIFLSFLFIALCLSPQVKTVLVIPSNQRMVVGEASHVKIDLPSKLQEKIEMKVMGRSRSVFAAQEEPAVTVTRCINGYEIMALKPGKADVRLNLWGLIPIKTIEIEAVPIRRVLAGGHSIGVLLQSQGIMVVGFAPVMTDNGDKLYPGRDQGIEIGDLILKVNELPVAKETDLAKLIDGIGEDKVQISLKRSGKDMSISVKPVHCPETDRYRIGLYVRDGVVGVGTLTFWDPDTRGYAALGHIIVDADTKQGINVLKGRVVSASIQTIKPGKPGRPGEKIGVFNDKGMISGNIIKNSSCGIFGQTDKEINNPLSQYTTEVAYAHQVKTGPAEILTVVNGDDIERFAIEIEKTYPPRKNGKDMVIKVVDPRLLTITGGIVQGMSGSPIIQDNRIVGAVTHVFLNDPKSGYGIYMDNILSEMPKRDPVTKNISTKLLYKKIPKIAG
ncbi:MAG: SpoIVB peptidase [Syntrophomonas sp.]|nr:SpoIVB peptidase [Syntrophomonas sp.]